MERDKAEISASLMCADFARLNEQLEELRESGIRRLHLDFVDGHFAPNLMLGTEVFALLEGHTGFLLESHLMVDEPLRLMHLFVGRSDWVIFHAETTVDPSSCINAIKAAGARAGVALRPETSIDCILPLLPYVSLVLVLTVPPGFAGGSFAAEAIWKVDRLRHEIVERGLDVEIEVDGGVNRATIPSILQAGATVLVGGSTGLFRGGNIRQHARELFALLQAT